MSNNKAKWIKISFVISIVLLFIKFYSYYLTNATSILTDALESIVNVVAASFASYSIYLSSLPKDDNHPYGHGKIECSNQEAIKVLGSYYMDKIPKNKIPFFTTL